MSTFQLTGFYLRQVQHCFYQYRGYVLVAREGKREIVTSLRGALVAAR